MNETGIYVQYRSYLNYQLPADDPSVVFVSLGEIASARLVKERVETPDPAKPGAMQTQYLRYVEIELSGDTALLADALQAERGEQAPLKKRWYGTSSTLYWLSCGLLSGLTRPAAIHRLGRVGGQAPRCSYRRTWNCEGVCTECCRWNA